MWSSRLLDVWLKLDWAKRHAEALKADMKRWCDVQSRQTTMEVTSEGVETREGGVTFGSP